MKLTKRASGNSKITLSKSEWEAIGRKAGWMKKAQAVAPAPTTVPTRTPAPAQPADPGKKPSEPFYPPKPKIMPKPKARKKKVTEAKVTKVAQYTDKAHQAVQNFWTNIPQDHAFAQHPILSEYGHNLSQEGFNYISNQMTERGHELSDAQGMAMEGMRLFGEIARLEAAHEEELVEMAKDITVQVWGIDKSMLEGDLTQSPGESGGDEGEEEEQQFGAEEQEFGGEEEGLGHAEMTPRLKGEIDKRITMNTLTQGSAVNAMFSVHHMAAEGLARISPDLVDLYTRLSGVSTGQYYSIDMPSIIQMVGSLQESAVGWSHVEYRDQEEGAEEGVEGQMPEQMPEPEQGQMPEPEQTPVVMAQGVCFPVLCQEFFKGVMELLTMHGLPQDLSEQELATVYHNSDKIEYEPWQIMSGHELWRKFTQVLPDDIPLSNIVMQLSQQPPERVEAIIRAVIQNPQAAKTLLGEWQ